jgi:hypothetical protein
VEITFLSDAHVISDEDSVRVEYPKRRPNLRANTETTEELFLVVGQRFVLFKEYVHVATYSCVPSPSLLVHALMPP